MPASPSPPTPPAYILRELALPALPAEGARADGAEPDLAQAIAAFLRIKRARIGSVRILRKSLDSRRRNHPLWRYAVEFTCDGPLKHPRLSRPASPGAADPVPAAAVSAAAAADGFRPAGPRVAIIGSGPAGLSAALALARKGYSIDVYEQGTDVGRRFRDIRRFLKGAEFNPRSNILFGEGGAGTFSDGKLTCRTRNHLTDAFLRELTESGADPSVNYLSHPHIGTDKLQFVIKGFRERCVALGCRFHFDTPVENLLVSNNKVTGIAIAAGPEGPAREETFDAVVLAAGHSARDLYAKLHAHGVAMDRKIFSVGVRVEHPQEMVNRRQLGDRVDPSAVGAAEYFLTWNGDESRSGPHPGPLSAYSFCMCPGGVVVPCADADDGLFTNGMSYSNRAGAFANSAVVVPVTPEELPPGVLAGVDFIRAIEVKGFQLGSGGRDENRFTFPAQTIRAFLDDRVDAGPPPKTSFPKPVVWANLRLLFPAKVTAALCEAFRDFDRKLPGFIDQGLCIGPESRTSSPVRILRDPATLESVSTRGLFPLGEGAGYSGGIVSSGADGFRLAEAWARSAQSAPSKGGSLAGPTPTAKGDESGAAGSTAGRVAAASPEAKKL